MLKNQAIRLRNIIPIISCLVALAGDPPGRAYERISKTSHGSDSALAMASSRQFALSDSNNSKILLGKLNIDHSRIVGENGPHWVLNNLIKAQPEDTIEWILDHYSVFNSYAKLNIASSLVDVNYRECLIVLMVELDDKSEILLESDKELPSPHWSFRVCDFAYNTLVNNLKTQPGFPAGLQPQLLRRRPISQRDLAIKWFRDWGTIESGVVLQSRPALAVTRPSIGNKMQILQERK